MLELYQSEGCPHSERVRQAMSELGLSYVTHNPRLPDEDDVRNRLTHGALVDVGGRDEIPLLVDTHRGETTYGDEQIVAYLEQNYG